MTRLPAPGKARVPNWRVETTVDSGECHLRQVRQDDREVRALKRCPEDQPTAADTTYRRQPHLGVPLQPRARAASFCDAAVEGGLHRDAEYAKALEALLCRSLEQVF